MSAPEASSNGQADLTALALSDRISDRMRKLLTAYMLSASVVRLAKRWVNQARSEATFSVSVAGDDELYPEVHRWLLDAMPASRRRSMTAKSRRSNSDSVVPVSSPQTDRAGTSLQMFYDGTRLQTVELDGHRIKVHVNRPDWSNLRTDKMEDMPRWLLGAERIVFTASDLDGRSAVIAFLSGLAEQLAVRKPRLWIAQRWGDWNRRSELPGRDLESVVLRGTQREDLAEDLRAFLGQEATYGRLGVPWHRGYLFHGPPGTGKTSVAKALAGEFGMDVYYIPLPAIPNDASLLQLLGGIEPRSMLLLEDLDVVDSARARDDGEKGITLNGLRNGLDGLITPHGLVTVMTTNDLGTIDRALVRPGRVDRVEEFPDLDDDQLARLVSTFLGRPVALPPLRRSLSPAAAIEVIKRHLDDPEAAMVGLKELLESA